MPSSPAWVAVFIALANAFTPCYGPDGQLSPPDQTETFVCDPEAEFSMCCAPGDMCTTNGFCKNSRDYKNNFFFRDTCTDRTWQSDKCNQHCKTAGVGFNTILACSETTYCCAPDGTNDYSQSNFTCCGDPDKVFDAGPANYLAGPSFALLVFSTTATATSALSSSVPTSIRLTSAFRSSTSAAGITPTSNATSSGTTATGSSQTAAPIPETSEAGGLSTAAKAGIGAGAVLLAFLAAAIVVLVFMRRKRRQKSRDRQVAVGGEVKDPMLVDPVYAMADQRNWYKPGQLVEVSADWREPTELPGNRAGHVSELPGRM